MYASVRSSKSDNDNFQRQGSLRKVIPPEHTRESLFDRQNADFDRVYKVYRQEYIILAEYKMIQSENLQGVYVIPSKESSLKWFGVIFVRSGPYEDGIFRFNILLDENFPDSEHPKVIFQSEIFHPVIDSTNNELNLLHAFPKWNKNDQHIWQVLKYIQWIFYNTNASIAHAANHEAAEIYRTNQNAFIAKAQEGVKLSKDHLYDEPPVEDKHYIIFEPFVTEVHNKVKASMMIFHEEPINKVGHSWVLPGCYKSLARPPTPPSETES
ncbi:protein crossbronx homolog [Anoplophora glabripennis]|uniref:protein crossbronx homolog n=1 Tax=Anoplophora glabripennis TaxID=217634 RepID=UPI000875580F|nr:protein crossbronx homolog [Anoplophora glabripennis]